MLNPFTDSKLTSKKEKLFLSLCFLIIITVLLHIFFLENKFIDGDDLTRVVQNPLIRNITLTGFGHDIKGFFLYHYPPFLLTYFWGLIFSIWELNHIGIDPAGRIFAGDAYLPDEIIIGSPRTNRALVVCPSGATYNRARR